MGNTNTTDIEYDYLTGLANRRGLYGYFDTLENDCIVHAMFLDIDNFKRVNDIYGHSMGDKLLIAISHLIQDHAHGFTARVGGDEYVAILDGNLGTGEVERIASSLIENMEHIDFRTDILSLVSLSIGVVFSQSASQPLDDILAKCDAAMYQSKNNGKNKYTIYQANDKTLEINRNIEAEMEDALKNREFQVYFQPKVNMVSSKLCGAEGLSRWVHPKDGVREPISYIPLFEKNGFIADLDMYIYEEVCRLKASWSGKVYEHIPVSVNMSRLHLYNKHFVDDLVQIAGKYNVPVTELEIEITENTFIKDNAELIHVIKILQDRGFTVSIDDFGSGYSALNLLKDLSVNTVKIDKEFLQTSSDTFRGRKVLRNVIALCRDLKIDVVAEGIETREQVDFITRSGCPIGQGFYYSRPVPADEFAVYAEEHLSRFGNDFSFRFNGSLKSEDGSMEGRICGEGLRYEDGIFKDSKSIYFPGGTLETNMIELPPEVIVNDSYTISMWVRPQELHQWSSCLYVKFETGFFSICPLAWEGHADFRIRDSREVNGWYDASSCQLQPDLWWHFIISYNANTEIATFFINGDVLAVINEVPTNRYVIRVALGGDVFQPSFIGNICELVIYNEAKDYDFMQELHESYINDSNFNGGPLKKLL
ncbi:MAG: EAL domain-containing protein [Eubacterium sp.]|nr:EAL domain-containing protein [Eubacterium sp.]